MINPRNLKILPDERRKTRKLLCMLALPERNGIRKAFSRYVRWDFQKYLAILCVWPNSESCPYLGHGLNMWFLAGDADGAQVLHEAEHPAYGRA